MSHGVYCPAERSAADIGICSVRLASTPAYDIVLFVRLLSASCAVVRRATAGRIIYIHDAQGKRMWMHSDSQSAYKRTCDVSLCYIYGACGWCSRMLTIYQSMKILLLSSNSQNGYSATAFNCWNVPTARTASKHSEDTWLAVVIKNRNKKVQPRRKWTRSNSKRK